MTQVAFIGSASGWGAQIRETEQGPEVLKSSGVLETLTFPWVWKETLYPLKSSHEVSIGNGVGTLPFIEDLCKRMTNSIDTSLTHREFPVVIGGDHSVAVGTWAGMTKHFNPLGLIWIDAHMDSHTPETTPSQAYHGMPLAALLGYGAHSLVNILSKSPLYHPQNVCLIGVRSYEEGEHELLKRLGVRIFMMDEIQSRGFKAVLGEALSIVKNGTKGYGITIDLDAFDPTEAPGVGSPVPFGLRADEVLPTLSLIQNDPAFKALEIVEFNPLLDKDSKTLLLMRDLLLNLIPSGRKI